MIFFFLDLLLWIHRGVSIFIHVKYDDVSSCQLIPIWHDQINGSLLESCEYNKWLYKEAASRSGIFSLERENQQSLVVL